MNNTIILLDNFDSFTYNLVDEFRNQGFEIKVFRNSIPAAKIFAEIQKSQNPILVISPGPGNPTEAGCLMELIGLCHRKVPMLGICLGHQAICQFYGAKVVPADEIMHGKSSLIDHVDCEVFAGIPNPAPFARYHSLVATGVPATLRTLAQVDHMVMAVQNVADRVIGFQFHPESIMSPYGTILLKNSIACLSKAQVSSAPSHALLDKLYAGTPLSRAETKEFFNNVMCGNISNELLTAALVGMKIRGETIDEISGAAEAIIANATPFPTPDYDFCDIVGTGGDGVGSINVSTTAAILVAHLGVKIAKHGNRSVSSKSGASDVLSTLGVKIDMSPATARACLDKIGICFLFAPLYHKGFKYAGPVRAALKTRTIFNVLGPLVNPAHTNIALIGVYSPTLVRPIAETLRALKYKKAFVVNGAGMDEVAVHAPTKVAELHENGEITEFEIAPSDFGFPQFSLDDIRGGNPQENAKLVKDILTGHGVPAHNAIVALNAAPLLYLTGKTPDLRSAVELAMKTLATGTAWQTAEALIAGSQS